MKIVFFGNTKYSRIIAEVLHKKFKLALVVTTPDKPKGRNRKLTPSPTKEFAQNYNIPLVETQKITNIQIDEIAKFSADFFAVADYGLILPPGLLQLPKFDSLNVHHSLLPKYRGPSPAPTTILNGDKISGVSIISMIYDVDAGDILDQKKYKLSQDETCDSLLLKLNILGAELVANVVENYQDFKSKKTKQNEKNASYTHRFSKTDGQIDPQNPPDPVTLDRMIRAFYPWPGTWCQLTVHGRQFTVKFLPNPNYPTTELSNYPNKYLIQPEGKNAMTFSEFLNGYPQCKPYLESLHLL